MWLAPDFAPRLPEPRLAELDASASTVIGLRADLSVGFRNSAWDRFAVENGAEELRRWNGRPIVEVFTPALRAFYEALLRGVQATGVAIDHDYACPNPARQQVFRLRVLPLEHGALLLTHHLHVVHAHGPPAEADAAVYRDAHGIVTQCAHCRHTRRADAPATWDWVPAYLDRMLPDVSHGLCPSCFRHYFPRAAAARDRAHAG